MSYPIKRVSIPKEERIRERLARDKPCIPYLKLGEPVVVTEGCFANVEAIFVANDGDERLMLLMNIMYRESTRSAFLWGV